MEKPCVLWTACVNNMGYGVKRHLGKNMLAHRVAFMKAYPDKDITGLCLMHKCDTPRCVEPTHLVPGTKWQNTQDMISKGRARNAKGPEAGKSRFTWEQIREIRNNYKGEKGELKALWTKYRVHKNSMIAILKGRSYIEGVAT